MILSKTKEDRAKALKTFTASKKRFYGNLRDHAWPSCNSKIT